MDTEWFAVDECGHVALFDSGQAGVVPEDAARSWTEVAPGVALAASLARVIPPAPVVLSTPRQPAHVPLESEAPGKPRLIFLASEADATPLLALQGASRAACTRGIAIRVGAVPDHLAAQLHATGACLTCRWERRDEPVAAAIYVFEHDDGDLPTPPYARVTLPERAVRLDELPEALREPLLRARLPGCFAAIESEEIQPAEHLRCCGYHVAWLDVARHHVRRIELAQLGGPMPPRDYASYIDRARDDLRARGFTWDPPE